MATKGKGKTGARIPAEEQIIIDTDSLRVGMSTVIDDRIDETLVSLMPVGACHGLHFKTANKTNVCYLLGGKVTIRLEAKKNAKRANDNPSV